MKLLHSRLPTGKATKSIYDNADTKDKCITLIKGFYLSSICNRYVLLFPEKYKFDVVKKKRRMQQNSLGKTSHQCNFQFPDSNYWYMLMMSKCLELNSVGNLVDPSPIFYIFRNPSLVYGLSLIHI